MDIRARLRLLGYRNHSLSQALFLFRRDFNVKGNTALSIRRLRELTDRSPTIEMLARVIYSESRTEPYRGQVAVGAVVLNRLNSGEFPNSLRRVITQPLAFSVIDTGTFWLRPNARAYKAAREALRGKDPTGGCLYFFNPDKSTSLWIRKLKPRMKIGRHVFAKELISYEDS